MKTIKVMLGISLLVVVMLLAGLPDVLAVAFPLAPTNFKVSEYSGEQLTLKLSWDPVENADLYIIYRSRFGLADSFVSLATTEKTFYFDSYVTLGNVYYYKVAAVVVNNTKYSYGFCTAVKFGVPMRTLPLHVFNKNATSLKLSWTGNTVASGYQVYRGLNRDGPFTRIITTSSTTYIDTGLTPGTCYYYYYRPYRSTVAGVFYGNWSAVKTGVPLATPVLTIQTISSTALRLTWPAVARRILLCLSQ